MKLRSNNRSIFLLSKAVVFYKRSLQTFPDFPCEMTWVYTFFVRTDGLVLWYIQHIVDGLSCADIRALTKPLHNRSHKMTGNFSRDMKLYADPLPSSGIKAVTHQLGSHFEPHSAGFSGQGRADSSGRIEGKLANAMI